MAPTPEMKSKSSQELESKDSNQLKEVDQLNSSDIGENLTKPQKNEGLDVARAVKEGDKYNIQGEEKKQGLDVEKETALSRLESRKQEDLEKNSLEDPKTEGEVPKTGEDPKTKGEVPKSEGEVPKSEGEVPKAEGEIPKSGGEVPKSGGEVPKSGEEESSRFSSLKDSIAYTIISLAETVGMGVSAIARGAVQEFGGETGGAGANGFSPADMLLLNRGMDPENLTKGMDPGEMNQERLTSEVNQERPTSGMD